MMWRSSTKTSRKLATLSLVSEAPCDAAQESNTADAGKPAKAHDPAEITEQGCVDVFGLCRVGQARSDG